MSINQTTFCFLTPGPRSFAVLSGDTRTSGGAESQVARIATALAARGHSVAMIYGGKGAGTTTRLGGVTCIDGYPAWRRPASIPGFWRTLRALRPALLYARLPDDFLALAGLFAALHQPTRLVYALANDSFCNPWRAYDYKPWLHNPLYALGMRSASVVAAQHEGQVALARPYVRGPIVQIPNLAPAIASGPRPFERADIDVIWVAQVRPEKRLPLLLDAAERLPELRFAIVGGFVGLLTAAEEERLRARIAGLPNVQFLGPQPADVVAASLARSKVLVNTSANEGFPNTMLEAWSLGVPVVSLAVDPGGVIARERLGLVSGDSGRLAADLRELCGDAAANAAYGTRGAAYVRAYHSLEKVCVAIEGLARHAGETRTTAREGGL